MGTTYVGGRAVGRGARRRLGLSAALVGAAVVGSVAGALLLRTPEATTAPAALAHPAISAERTSLDLEMGLVPDRHNAAAHEACGWETGSAYCGPERVDVAPGR
jgi:hypothetical protein